MTYQKTTWKNKLVERPGTFTFRQNADGSVTLLPSEGKVIEAGTPVNAENMNKIENFLEELDKRKIKEDMVVQDNGVTLKEELKHIPRFDKPNFKFKVVVQANNTLNVKHNLGYQPLLFSLSTTVGNVNPTAQIGRTEITLHNNTSNDCSVEGFLW